MEFSETAVFPLPHDRHFQDCRDLLGAHGDDLLVPQAPHATAATDSKQNVHPHLIP
jgi:hypothetical protein